MHLVALHTSKMSFPEGKNSGFQCFGSIFSVFIPEVEVMQFLFFLWWKKNLPTAISKNDMNISFKNA